MATTKRQKKQMERQLVANLTEACEVAKAEIPGFDWLTHDNGSHEFPTDLRVTWIFDTQANLERAIGNGDDRRMQALTKTALAETGIDPQTVSACLQFDSEEACAQAQGGDWVARLAQIRRTRH